ncbi:MAG: DUF364 domain-containing protein [candidate division WOR-3 bacterium]
MTDIFSMLRERALDRLGPGADYLIRGLWKVELAFRPNPAERTFQYTFWLAMNKGQGCCYCTGDDERGRELVGQDARDIVKDKTCISIAVLDALYGSLPRQPAVVHRLSGTPIEKTAHRTGVIMAEAIRLAELSGKACPRVVNVGVVGNVIRELKGRGYEVLATDLERDLVGSTVHGVLVEDGTRTFDYVRDSDLAIVTGMTIATDSLELIVEEARRAGTRLLLFAETGANFGAEYCQTIGIDTVVSEPFPFYIFQGMSTIEVFRREP